MHEDLKEELKAFEKDLSLLLVRFMKICDAVEKAKARPAMPPRQSAEDPVPIVAVRRVEPLRGYV